MRKIIKIFKITLFLIYGLIIFIVFGGLTTLTVKNVMKIALVEQFKKNAVYQDDLSTDKVKMYKIESNEEFDSIEYSFNEIYPGYKSDILLSTQADLSFPIINAFVSYFAGGHAGICVDSMADKDILVFDGEMIEATGMNEGENLCSSFSKNYWIDNEVYNEVIGVRCKITEKQRNEVMVYSAALMDDPYNYTFLFDTKNKSYCSDLITKAYSHVGINLNKDGFTTSIYDIIVSSDTYISYYHYYDTNGVRHVYYLD